MPTFVMSVDVEPDSPAWSAALAEFRVENIPALERLQAVCDRYGVRPTYLTTYAVATDPSAEKVLARLRATGRCEIGAHLHPADTPPKLDRPRPETSIPHLPADVKEAKLRNLHVALAERFGPPTAFRAGRYRLDAPCVGILESLGYRADTSVTPHVSWRLEGGPRWSAAPDRPYRLSRTDPARLGDSPIVEIPVTIRESRRFPLPGGALLSDLFSMPFRSLPRPLSRAFEWVRPVRPEWLRPTYLDAGALASLVDAVLDEQPDATLNMMFHSNELVPGTSPFVRTEEEARVFLDRIDALCRHVISRGAVPLTLTETAARVAGEEAVG
jgi:hypothetical protein